MARHVWVKVRLHVYICRTCGTGRVNAQDRTGGWFTTFYRPDGTHVISATRPPCEVGPWTDRYRARYLDSEGRLRVEAIAR